MTDRTNATARPDVIVIMTDEERAAPPYETSELREWRRGLPGAAWFDEHAVSFDRHYTGSLACVPSRPTMFTGQYPDVHGVTQTDGLGKMADDSRMRWMRPGEVPTLGNWFRAAGYDTHYDGKWHISHADLIDPTTGQPLATNDADGNVLAANVEAYLDADPLAPYGFSGWVGPEPHGGLVGNSGMVRDELIADRVTAWLTDRYARRRAGDASARRPFLLVASFVNPHDIVLFPLWIRRGMPAELAGVEVPPVPAAPTADEDLTTKPAAQIAYRNAYPSCYGPPGPVAAVYRDNARRYRELYYQLHAVVDAPLDRVRRAVTESTTGEAIIVRTADHGELLGAHGGLHQKWFQLYDESTRVPFAIARVGVNPTTGRRVSAPTSHVDLVPTLLAAASIDATTTAGELAATFTEVHPLPGRNLMPVVAGGPADDDRAVYVMTRDNMPEGDTGVNAMGRLFVTEGEAPAPLRIEVPAYVASNFEGVVCRVRDEDAPGGGGHLWKLTRCFDDPGAWTEPGVRQLASDGVGGPQYRTLVLADQWELYDLESDPAEADNRVQDPAAADVLAHLRRVLKVEQHRSVPERNVPWPYATSRLTEVGDVPLLPPRDLVKMQFQQRRAARSSGPRPPVRLARKLLRRLGMHPADPDARRFDLAGCRAVVVATNHGRLEVGKPTGLFASELTVPYYAFVDAGIDVDVASPLGGVVPVDPLSLKPAIRTAADDRMLADPDLRGRLERSLPIGELDMADYDIVFLAGGWGAAFDLGTSESLGAQITAANAAGAAIGGVCHGPLGLLRAEDPDGRPLVAGRRVTAVTDKQVRELGITSTPMHPETELRAAGAVFESAHAFRDPLANHWVVDGNLVTGQNQNAGPMVARELMDYVARHRH